MKYFNILELTRSTTAGRLGLNNMPSDVETDNLVALIDNILDPAREALGSSINVTSGFRCPALNAAVKGAKNSQHVHGEAADLVSSDNKKLFTILYNKGGFDQLIWEKGDDSAPAWVHVSFKRNGKNRGEVLRFNGKKYSPFKL